MFQKIIIWGHPLYSHTHSYVNYGYERAFKKLGYTTFWFHDNDFPKDFDYSNSLFFTEGYADQNIPINNSSIYVVHCCRNPEKYYGQVNRLIDLRFNYLFLNDCNYNYILDESKCVKISDATYYEKLIDTSSITKYKDSPISMNWEAIYTTWATDLLPEEINFDWKNLEREKKIYYSASISNTNEKEVHKFKAESEKNGILFTTFDPWSNPYSMEENRARIQKSFIMPDIRGSGMRYTNYGLDNGCNHKLIGTIPCRIFKTISYGQLGGTNSKRIYDFFDHVVIYDDDESKLFHKMLEKKDDKQLIQKQMELVKEKHTYINRAKDLLYVIENFN